MFVVDKDIEAIKNLVKEFPTVKAKLLDLLNWKETAEVVGSFGPIHHLVNNAGISGSLVSFLDIKPEGFDRFVLHRHNLGLYRRDFNAEQ